ncbi:hypothetical protein ACEN2J_18865 [Pseudorhodobacter sp. W20_MBD10_FR17]|uniref:hypothetical protein n=1 Tax=Pseudorhodobacter sp. W20_MBD10_FR17 TaxID=3240266 RepID=UPI003F99105B
MLRIVRPISLVLLCLALVAGSVSMAVAKGQAAAMSNGGTTIVICSGYGVLSITLDDQGNPVGPVHPCPECLAGLAAYLPPDSPTIAALTSAGERVVAIGLSTRPRAADVLVTRARGPPLMG